MSIDMFQHTQRIKKEAARAKAIRAKENARGITAWARIPHRERRRHNIVRRLLPVEDLVRDHRPVIIPIHDSWCLHACEDRVRLAHALLVVEPVVKRVAAPFLRQRKPTKWVVAALEG